MNRIVAIVAATVVASPLAAAPISDVYTSYFAFGDSLTDDGKNGDRLDPPSFGGRYTNGLTYSEMSAEGFSSYKNYALGGATAGPNNIYIPFYAADVQQFATLDRQVDYFTTTGDYMTAGDNPLVSILMGSNDIFQQSANPLYDVRDTVDYVIDAILDIAALDPAFDDFVVPYSPGAFGDNAYVQLRTDYNDYLDERAAELEAQGLNIIQFSLDVGTLRILDDLEGYGITEEGPCAPAFNNVPVEQNCTFVGYDEDDMPIFDLDLANAYRLADPVHPTTPVHTEWSKELVGAVEADLAAEVPLPASGLLLLAGLGGVAGFRRRARAA